LLIVRPANEQRSAAGRDQVEWPETIEQGGAIETMFRKHRSDSKQREAEKVRQRAAAGRIDDVMRERAARGDQAFAEEIERRRQSAPPEEQPQV